MFWQHVLAIIITLIECHSHTMDWVHKMIEASHSNNLFTFKRKYATHKPTAESLHGYRQERDVPDFAYYNYQQITKENHNWCSLYR